MNKVKTLLEKLSKYYWSDKHPSKYLLPGGGGIGRLATTTHPVFNYAAFSLVWAVNPLQTQKDHLDGIKAMVPLARLLQQEVNGVSVADHITMRTPEEFAVWYSSHRSLVNPALRLAIEEALNAVGKLQSI